MDKYRDNGLVEEMDDIILLNENYAKAGLHAGYIGTVMDNYIKEDGVVIADFSNPVTGECLQPAIEIRKEDFRVFSGSREDQKAGRAFRELFKK